MTVASDKFKSAVVTGHTRGIGKAISENFQNRGLEVIGFSKSQGNDISDPSVQDKILDACRESQFFINNAHSGFHHVQLLYKVFEQWQYEDKWIVNIGVDLVPMNQWDVVYRAYSVEKVALHAAIAQLQQEQRNCRILNIRLNHVNTDTYVSDDPSIKKLEIPLLISTMNWLISSPDNIEIKDITLAAR